VSSRYLRQWPPNPALAFAVKAHKPYCNCLGINQGTTNRVKAKNNTCAPNLDQTQTEGEELPAFLRSQDHNQPSNHSKALFGFGILSGLYVLKLSITVRDPKATKT